ncbi:MULTISPECIES: alpha/beta hydrolase [unclassified Pseudomonas]|uniref:alpha/beta fold hydrolase n=1 Tax=unclassified Pseudomonas TaxID=196821 RepID=UPI002453DD8D|nr:MULTISPECIES: alpha/beta hydrolase [unclassified Pseudomonas]MDH4561322.1 alpha/beta hydrolase [Pseudomonas sp. BN411]MDH4656986.1 alpha/beta hydrolase [Pseudomonas sp. BN606]
MNSMTWGDARVDHSGFQRDEFVVEGTRTIVYSAGQGEPLVFFHGAGTWHGIDFARAWIDRFRVILPYHPGFGESDDSESASNFHGYIDHYRNLFSLMNLSRFHLVGFSLGGRLAAEYAAENTEQITKLALIAPAGLEVQNISLPDLREVKPEEFPAYMVNDLSTLKRYLPDGFDPQFIKMRERETSSTMRLLSDGFNNLSMPELLQKLSMPSLIAWGQEDRLLPAPLAVHWHKHLPNAQIQFFADAGHLVLDESVVAREAVAKFLSATPNKNEQ